MTRLQPLPPRLHYLLPAHVAVGAMPVTEIADRLPAAERSLVEQAVPQRQREFATGRVLARCLLRDLGVEVESIPQRADRTPVWPSGIVGSISHCHDLCLVAVGRTSDGIRSIGVDVESAQPLPSDLWSDIACGAELTWAKGGSIASGMAMCRLFSAKETVYKCIYPVIQRILEFHDVELEFSPDYNRFEARISSSADPPVPASNSVAGRQLQWERWILTATIWHH